ncbi:MAG: Holliday junction resolvase RuvX [Candidatus Omnitrophica bacterium]|nr:Holliday junction resolvase RuvX [Candidatus Omnitrophota bacterium]
MRIIALDLGQKRVGVAMSDALGIIAQGLDTIKRENIDSLKEIIEENDVTEIVVGLPLNMDGTEGPSAKNALSFADELKKKYSISVKMWDERLSTRFVEREMIKGDLSRNKRKSLSDKLAAVAILQNYLDSRRQSNVS